MQFVFWSSFAMILYAYIGYPLLLKVFFALNKKAQHVDDGNPFQPPVSIIIPVHNEEKVIEEKITNTLSLDYPASKLEVIVVSDASTDRTGAIVHTFLSQGVRFFHQPERQGKAGALNRGLQEAGHGHIVFTDASILLEQDALGQLLACFADPSVGCVSGEDSIPGGGGEGAYGRYELWLRNLESKVSSIVGASGCFYAQRRDLCEPFPDGMAPDFFSVLKTVEKGYRAVTQPKARGVMRSVPKPAGELQRKIRTILRGLTTLLHFRHLLNPLRYGFFSVQLISHKLMRWSVCFFLALLLVSNLLLLPAKTYTILFCLQAAFYSMAALSWRGVSGWVLFRFSLFFVMVNLAALIAWFKYLRGIRQEIWEPSKR